MSGDIGLGQVGVDGIAIVRAQISNVPLIVDLDGTLSSVDTLHESLLLLISKRPMQMTRMAGWLRRGKAGFKAAVAAEAVADAGRLPLREGVLARMRQARAEGRSVLLVSAADQRQVEAVADHVGLFDEAIGSDGRRNLAGAEKAAWLVARFGPGGFDYIGDSRADLETWRQARMAITVGISPSMRRQVEALSTEVEHLLPAMPPKERLRTHLRAMRPHQWLKNLLVLAPALAAHDAAALLPSMVAFVAFCLASSSVYLVNDLLDIEADRRHPRKRLRPFAAGLIPISAGLAHAAGLIVITAVLALLISPLFLAVLAGYLALTFAYSLYLKRKLMIDIWTLGALYTIRIVAGAAASNVPLSEWLLAFSMFLFLSLAAVKRQSELADLVKRAATETEGRGYRVSDIPVILGVVLAAGYCSVLVLALYISSISVSELYSRPALLWLICPLLLYWISRATIISYRGEMDDDPIVFAIKDKISIGIFALAGLFVVLSATS